MASRISVGSRRSCGPVGAANPDAGEEGDPVILRHFSQRKSRVREGCSVSGCLMVGIRGGSLVVGRVACHEMIHPGRPKAELRGKT